MGNCPLLCLIAYCQSVQVCCDSAFWVRRSQDFEVAITIRVSHDSDFDPDQMETIRIMKQAINHDLVGGLICLIPVNPSKFRLSKNMLDVPILSSGWWFMNGNGALYPLVITNIAIENCPFCSLIY